MEETLDAGIDRTVDAGTDPTDDASEADAALERDGSTAADAFCCPPDAAASARDAAVFPDDTAVPHDAGVGDDAARVDAGVGDAGGSSGTCDAWPGGSIDVLFIGNSQIEVSNLPRVVRQLSESAPVECARIVPALFTLGGANLRDLWERHRVGGLTLAETLASGGYEVVVITESIDLAEYVPAPFPMLFIDYATRIIDAARAAGAIPLLYATPYVDAPDRSGFHAQADPQLMLGRDLGVGVAAGGLAWLRVWDESPDLDLHASDHAHPGCLGTYVSASVLWAAISGGNPIGLDYSMMIESDTGFCPPISAANADLFQRAAWAQQLATGP